MKTLIIATAALAFSFAADEVISTWSLDKNHSSFEFGVNHMGLAEFKGRFTDFDVKINGGTKADFSDISVTMTAKTESISTGNESRDGHLKSADFFNTEVHKEITFKSTAVKSAGKGKLSVTGDLTFNGITKSIVLTAEAKGPIDHPQTKKKAAGFTVRGKIKRSDFKFGAGMPAPALGDEVNIYANLEMGKDQ